MRDEERRVAGIWRQYTQAGPFRLPIAAIWLTVAHLNTQEGDCRVSGGCFSIATSIDKRKNLFYHEVEWGRGDFRIIPSEKLGGIIPYTCIL